ncbi:hypothetical protein GCM10017784_32070 [Deinococcus indicus]|uniref:hypothetical protein n=1 Tax=Deinococcus indicus TaxID=223556 RepID=UPI00174E3154|nr:hypothetical protein [Deinococcus indicus]GHG35639.1 hypothetical protein GCM10017784_32070 [Deinococcus indicus]
MSPLTPMPEDLPGMLAFLQRCDWEFRLVGRTLPDGTRLFTAIAWRPDSLGGGRKCRAADPVLALHMAVINARKARQRRHSRKGNA